MECDVDWGQFYHATFEAMASRDGKREISRFGCGSSVAEVILCELASKGVVVTLMMIGGIAVEVCLRLIDFAGSGTRSNHCTKRAETKQDFSGS